MKILIINGPNLNLIGKREPSIYGSTDFETWFAALRRTYAARNVELTYRQSNIEGELIDCIQAADGRYDGVILNAGGYTLWLSQMPSELSESPSWRYISPTSSPGKITGSSR